MIRLLALALLAAGCAPMDDSPDAPPPPAADESYRALGTEPFWAVTIAGGRMTYDAPGEPGFTVPRPEPRTTVNGHRYETPRLTMDVTHSECSDGMSDRRYPDTVTVMTNGTTLNGCGGGAVPPASLDGTNWSIVKIGDDAMPAGDRYFLRFREGRIEGKAGCNGFGGPYTQDGERVQPGPLISTRMACPGPAMEHERRALGVLGGAVTLAWPDGDTLVVSRDGESLTLRRSY